MVDTPEATEAVAPKAKRDTRPKPKKPPARKSRAKKAAAKKLARTKNVRPYPRVTFNDALQVPLRIKELNNGKPWDPEDVAKALGMGAKAPRFFYVTAASRDFGFTVGTRDTPKIELTDLGRDVVYAPNPETERAKKLEAFTKVEIFKRVLEHFGGSQLGPVPVSWTVNGLGRLPVRPSAVLS